MGSSICVGFLTIIIKKLFKKKKRRHNTSVCLFKVDKPHFIEVCNSGFCYPVALGFSLL